MFTRHLVHSVHFTGFWRDDNSASVVPTLRTLPVQGHDAVGQRGKGEPEVVGDSILLLPCCGPRLPQL